MPSIRKTGGATVLTSPYGMPPSLLVMDQFQPPTWVVGVGALPLLATSDLEGSDPEYVTIMANAVYESATADSWSGVGFWLNDGLLYVEPVRTFTNAYMAHKAAKENGQMAIYAMHLGVVELVAQEAQVSS